MYAVVRTNMRNVDANRILTSTIELSICAIGGVLSDCRDLCVLLLAL